MPQPELLVEVTRGDAVESRHYGHVAVVDAAGRVLFSLGDADHPTYPRSSLKPLQALAGLVRGTAERFNLTDAEVAVICASHAAEPRHIEAVIRILAKIDAAEEDLHCGPHAIPHLPTRDRFIREGRDPTRLYNNCSGKHSGMLALARVLGAPLSGYWEPEHPVQREIQRVLVEHCGAVAGSLAWGTDGCGVPTYRMPLRELAQGFARLATPETLAGDAVAGRRIVTAMNAEPEMVRGEGGFDSVLMRALPGVLISKGGAEGCHTIGIVDRGIGLAIKVEDGAARPLAPVALSVLRKLGLLPELPPALQALVRPPILNTRQAPVGEIRPAALLSAD